ncbi:hypothetical protein A5C_1618 [Vibrio cholerae NCTC 8457]|nr:hypothetical protein A5C_1618 [Vibrio cholerae NCTC 8457]
MVINFLKVIDVDHRGNGVRVFNKLSTDFIQKMSVIEPS